MKRDGGFSLLEFLLAVAFFSTVVAWVLYINVTSLRTIQEIERRFYIEKGVVEYQLEVLRAQSFDTLSTAPIVGGGNFLTPVLDSSDLNYSSALASAVTSWVYTVTSPSSNMKQVTVTVQWTDPFQHPRTSVGTTLIGKFGLTDPG